MNSYFGLEGEQRIDKRDPAVVKLKEWIDEQIQDGRMTIFGDAELDHALKRLMPETWAELSARKKKCERGT